VGPDSYRVVVAGAGVAGLEAVLALRRLAGERLEISVIEPHGELTYRPLSVAEPFGAGRVSRFPLGEVLGRVGAQHHRDWIATVDAADRCVTTVNGDAVGYDALLVACGGRPVSWLPGALTFHGSADRYALGATLDDLVKGRARHVAFVVPSRPSWSLPLYELALMTAAHLSDAGSSARVLCVTPEAAPLETFGAAPSRAIAELLRERGIRFVGGTDAIAADEGELLASGGVRLEADRVVTLPQLEGPRIPGLPFDRDGFIPTSADAAVRDVRGAFAAGDATDFPIKQGGLAAQQGEAAAHAIAARAGAAVRPRPFRGVLRGMLLTGGVPRYLRAETTGGQGVESEVSVEPLWWPPSKIAGRYLAPLLAELAGQEPIESSLPSGAVVVDVDLGPRPGSTV
jgi:sulfide:quinone oxidoreductase